MRATAAVFLFFLSFPLLGADLSVITDPLDSTDPGVPVSRPIRVVNLGPDVAQDLTLTVTLPAGVRYDIDQTNGWSCATASPGIICTIASLPVYPQHSGSTIDGSFVFDPSLGGQSVLVRIDITASNGAARYPWAFSTVVRQIYRVSTTADSGAGSLRDVIDSVNTTCLRDCRIDFDLPAGSLIEPLTPLPVITACARLDVGTAPVTRTGDRAIELSGARLTTGHGLVYRATCPGATGASPLLWINGLAINRFPWNAIHIAEGPFICRGCFIGTDLTGRQARANGRGISVDHEHSFVRILESVLSGNHRSALFAWTAREVRVEKSSIGTTPEGLPLPNGASGIFIRHGFLVATESTIANNRDFGIAVSTEAKMLTFANAMPQNGVQAIDYQLDGRTLHAPNMPDVPELTGAVYDAASGKTIVTGRVTITRAGVYRHLIDLYVDDASVSTGINLPFRVEPGDHTFTVQHTGDLRGKRVTVTNSRGYDEQDGALAETSEMSNGATVQ